MNNFILNYAIAGNYNSGNPIVSIDIASPGIYLLIGYNHNQNNLAVWLNGIADQNDFGYLRLQNDGCIAKIFSVGNTQTFKLMNLSGQTMNVNTSTYLGAIRLGDL